jgi:hypothetical protein
VNDAFLFSSGNLGSNADRRIKRGDSRAESAHTFAEDALGDQFKFNCAGIKLFVEIFRAWAGKSCDDLSNLAILEKESEFAVSCAAIIADDFQVASAMPCKALNKIVGESGAAKPAEHDRSAVGNVRNSRVH